MTKVAQGAQPEVVVSPPSSQDPHTVYSQNASTKNATSTISLESPGKKLSDMPTKHHVVHPHNIDTPPALTPSMSQESFAENLALNLEAQSTQILEKHDLSKAGKKVVTDIQNIAATSNDFLAKVNSDGLIEKIQHNIENIYNKKDELDPTEDLDTRALRKEARAAAKDLADIAKLTITSAEFRSILGDLVNVSADVLSQWARDVEGSAQALADTAHQKAQSGISSATKALDQAQDAAHDTINQTDSAAKNTIESGRAEAKNWQREATSASPDNVADKTKESTSRLTSQAQSAVEDAKNKANDALHTSVDKEKQIHQNSKHEIARTSELTQKSASLAQDEAIRVLESGQISDHRQGGLVQDEKLKKFDTRAAVAPELVDQVQNAKNVAESSYQQAQSEAGKTWSGANTGSAPSVATLRQSKDAAVESGKATLEQVKAKVSAEAKPYLDAAHNARVNLERDVADKLDIVKDRVENFQLSDQQLEKIRTSIKNIALDIEVHPEYSRHVNNLIGLFGRFRRTITPLQQGLESTSEDSDVVALVSHFKVLLERISNSDRSLDGLYSRVQSLTTELSNDDEAIHYWARIINILRASFTDPAYVQSTEYTEEFDRCWYEGERIFGQKESRYREAVQAISDDVSHFAYGIRRNRELRKIETQVDHLVKDAFLDKKGRVSFKPELLEDLKMVLPSLIRENLANVKLPRIDYADEDYIFTLDDLVLRGDKIVPEFLAFDIKHVVNVQLAEQGGAAAEEASQTFVRVQMQHMYVSAERASFSYKKKSGISMSDQGLLSFNTPEKSDGISIDLLLQPDFTPSQRHFKVAECNCTIDSMELSLNDVKHNILYAVLKPILNKIAKKKIEEAVASQVLQLVFSIDGQVQKSTSQISSVLSA